jgi:hypothetical protein
VRARPIPRDCRRRRLHSVAARRISLVPTRVDTGGTLFTFYGLGQTPLPRVELSQLYLGARRPRIFCMNADRTRSSLTRRISICTLHHEMDQRD